MTKYRAVFVTGEGEQYTKWNESIAATIQESADMVGKDIVNDGLGYRKFDRFETMDSAGNVSAVEDGPMTEVRF